MIRKPRGGKTATRRTPKKWKVVFIQTVEKDGLTWSQAQAAKADLQKSKYGRRKGTVIKTVSY